MQIFQRKRKPKIIMKKLRTKNSRMQLNLWKLPTKTLPRTLPHISLEILKNRVIYLRMKPVGNALRNT
jgi:hypothetical protein